MIGGVLLELVDFLVVGGLLLELVDFLVVFLFLLLNHLHSSLLCLCMIPPRTLLRFLLLLYYVVLSREFWEDLILCIVHSRLIELLYLLDWIGITSEL
jgi:hypothetical protein